MNSIMDKSINRIPGVRGIVPLALTFALLLGACSSPSNSPEQDPASTTSRRNAPALATPLSSAVIPQNYNPQRNGIRIPEYIKLMMAPYRYNDQILNLNFLTVCDDRDNGSELVGINNGLIESIGRTENRATMKIIGFPDEKTHRTLQQYFKALLLKRFPNQRDVEMVIAEVEAPDIHEGGKLNRGFVEAVRLGVPSTGSNDDQIFYFLNNPNQVLTDSVKGACVAPFDGAYIPYDKNGRAIVNPDATK
jgi:hypothetical protein